MRVGPDGYETVAFSISEDWTLQARLHASELRLRGTGAVVQPHRDPAGNILCWNGEVRPYKPFYLCHLMRLQVFDGLEVGRLE
jgi:asparagine synthetase B (glutamine-hydrolysing)